MSDAIRILSAGAAESLIGLISARFTAETGFRIDASFAGLGVVMKRLEKGEHADVVVLTQPAIAELKGRGLIAGGGVATIGAVATSLAVKAGYPPTVVQNRDDLQAALKSADAIHVPDFETTTAGQHIRRMLEILGMVEELHTRLRFAPNGASAMRALAEAQEEHAVGCAQASEILAAQGTTFVADLPSPFSLSTHYAMAVTAGSQSAQAAYLFIEMVTAASAASVRKACGFVQLG
jgi:molybdate transport system substrate-binding protein